MNQKQEEFLTQLQINLGVVSLTCEKVKVSRDEYDGWLSQKDFKDKLDKVNELCIDYVEQQLLKKINQGDLNAIQFYLKTKGKKRGY